MARRTIGVVIHRNLLATLFSSADLDRLRSLGDVRFTDSPTPITPAEAGRLLADCEVGLGSWGTPYPTAELLAAAPKLRLWEHAAGTVKRMFGPHLEGRDLTIASCKTAIADNVAAFAVGQIILGLWRMLEDFAQNRRGVFQRPAQSRVLWGATVGVVGASEVGRRVIRLLAPYGCTVLLYDPFVSADEARSLGVTPVADLTDLCRRGDVVTLHAPAIPATEKMIGPAQFAAMRDEAVFINTARGHCVDHDALVARCRQGALTCYLDVTDPQEPAPADSPLRSLPNVHLTSHMAGGPGRNIGHQAVNDIEAFLAGRSPLSVARAQDLHKQG